jgi:hypothetical protein
MHTYLYNTPKLQEDKRRRRSPCSWWPLSNMQILSVIDRYYFNTWHWTTHICKLQHWMNTVIHTNLKGLVTVIINLRVTTQHTAEYLLTNSNAPWRKIHLNGSSFALKYYTRSARLLRPSQTCKIMAALHYHSHVEWLCNAVNNTLRKVSVKPWCMLKL